MAVTIWQWLASVGVRRIESCGVREKWTHAARAGLAATSLVLLWSCADTSAPAVDPELQRVLAMGFRPDMIEDHGDYFLVEGDIVILKTGASMAEPADTLPAGHRYQRGPEFQYRSSNIVSHGVSKVMKVKILSSVESGWASATRSAMVEWSNISGSVIDFTENATADITVSMNSGLGGGVIAQATFPVGSPTYKPGPTVQINPSYNSYDIQQKIYVMVHELGHTIGFRHTNWASQGESSSPYGAIQIGSTTTDGSSVMNGATGGTYYTALSGWDQDAARIMYPLMPVVTVVDQGAGNPYLVSWTSNPSVTSYAVTLCWTITDEYEGQYYQYDACTPYQNNLDTTTTFANIGSPDCSPYFTVRPVFAAGSAFYWSPEQTVWTGCN